MIPTFVPADGALELGTPNVPLTEIATAIVIEALNEGDLAVLRDHVSDDIVDISPRRLFFDGRIGLAEAIVTARHAMPDLYARITGTRCWNDGCVELSMLLSGTYRAPNLAPSPWDGQLATWCQRHLWWFSGPEVHAHRGFVEPLTTPVLEG